MRQDPTETYAPLRVLMWKLAAFGMLAIAVVALLRWRLGRRIGQPINALVERVHPLGPQGAAIIPTLRTRAAGARVEPLAL